MDLADVKEALQGEPVEDAAALAIADKEAAITDALAAAANAEQACDAAVGRAEAAEAAARGMKAENAALGAALERTLAELDDLTQACADLHARAAMLGNDLRNAKGKAIRDALADKEFVADNAVKAEVSKFLDAGKVKPTTVAAVQVARGLFSP